MVLKQLQNLVKIFLSFIDLKNLCLWPSLIIKTTAKSTTTAHSKIKFTIEKETENQLSFINLLITSNGDNFLTSDCCKKHSIGLYTNYLRFTAFSYKIGLGKTLLHRALAISGNW